MPEFVSVAGGGDLGVQVDIPMLYNDIDIPFKEYEPEQFPACYLRFQRNGPKIILFRTGKYNIYGGDSPEAIHCVNRKFVAEIGSLLEVQLDSTNFEIRNLVYMEDYDTEWDLNELVLLLGLNQAEYEPEQFPGVIFRPESKGYIFLIYRSGKAILTGISSATEVDQAFAKLEEALEPALP